MTWLGALTVAKTLFGKLWTALSHASLWQLVSLGLAIFAAVQHFQLVDARHDADKWQRQYTAEHNGRLADRTAYEQAQKDAAAKNLAAVGRVEAQYQRNSDDERQSYLDDLARVRADNQRLRSQGASAAPGATGATGSPEAGAAAPGADGDELHLSPDEHLQASEIELRLMHLQNWIATQLAVDPNAG